MLSSLCVWSCLYHPLIIFFDVCRICIDIPFHYLYQQFVSFFFVSLAKSLSILMNFSKKQVLVSFSLFFLFSISLISVLFSFFPYSCFGFILFYFSRFLRCELRLLIWSETHLDFFFFLMYAFSAINALLRWAPQMLIYFHIHSVPCIFFYFLWGFHFDARIT